MKVSLTHPVFVLSQIERLDILKILTNKENKIKEVNTSSPSLHALLEAALSPKNLPQRRTSLQPVRG